MSAVIFLYLYCKQATHHKFHDNGKIASFFVSVVISAVDKSAHRMGTVLVKAYRIRAGTAEAVIIIVKLKNNGSLCG